ncbi:MAG: RNA polymerase subunit sigma-70 [Thalassobius sp.]|nr:RNA polymerase subunit sigma-70 [Thalassovita sp.]
MNSLKLEKKFTELVTCHQGIIHKVCGMYCKHEEARKDLFQEIVVQLWRSFPSFRGDSQVTTWMYRVALNTAISSFRKEVRKPDEESISNKVYQIPVSNKLKQEQEEQISFMYKAIEQLSQVEKAVIMLYLEEYSYDEIAKITGMTRTNVGVKINRIKAKLQKILKPVYNEIR